MNPRDGVAAVAVGDPDVFAVGPDDERGGGERRQLRGSAPRPASRSWPHRRAAVPALHDSVHGPRERTPPSGAGVTLDVGSYVAGGRPGRDAEVEDLEDERTERVRGRVRERAAGREHGAARRRKASPPHETAARRNSRRPNRATSIATPLWPAKHARHRPDPSPRHAAAARTRSATLKQTQTCRFPFSKNRAESYSRRRGQCRSPRRRCTRRGAKAEPKVRGVRSPPSRQAAVRPSPWWTRTRSPWRARRRGAERPLPVTLAGVGRRSKLERRLTLAELIDETSSAHRTQGSGCSPTIRSSRGSRREGSSWEEAERPYATTHACRVVEHALKQKKPAGSMVTVHGKMAPGVTIDADGC